MSTIIKCLYSLLRVEAKYINTIDFLDNWINLLEHHSFGCPSIDAGYEQDEIEKYEAKSRYYGMYCGYSAVYSELHYNDRDYFNKYDQKLLNGIKTIKMWVQEQCSKIL